MHYLAKRSDLESTARELFKAIDDGIIDDVYEDGKQEFTCEMWISLGISSCSLLLLDARITK